jgi:Ca2+-binding RTX toxin-like protein
VNGYIFDDSLLAFAGNDTLDGSLGADRMDGGAGNDNFYDEFGADSMVGGTGNDSYRVDDPGDVVVEKANQGVDSVSAFVDYVLPANVENLSLAFTAYNATGNDLDNVIQADGQHDNLLDGAGGDDSLSAWIGNDTLIGGDGNDTLDGGPGDDSMVGGAGNDTYIVDSTGDLTVELPGGGIDMVVSSVDHVLQAEVENLTLAGAATVGFGNELGNRIISTDASSYLTGREGNDTIYGAASNDTLLGDEGNDRLNSGTGDDSLDGGSGADRMTGGLGDDVYVVDDAGDRVIEHDGQGTDTVVSSVDYVLAVNVETLQLTGTAIHGTGNGLDNDILGNDGDNVLSGRGGDDFLIGLGGSDTLLGGAGNDTLSNGPDGGDALMMGGAGDDGYVNWGGATVVEAVNQGTDSVLSLVDYVLPDNVEDLDLFHTAHSGTGNALDNIITGSGQAGQDLDGAGGNDFLIDSAGNDRLVGGDGNDTLSASYGVDTLTGGAGSDHFVQSGDLSAGPDSIADFTLGAGGDVLDISDLLTGFDAGTSDPNDFVQCETTGGNTTVKVDADGAAGGAAFTDVCVLSGVSTATDQLVAGGNLELTAATA